MTVEGGLGGVGFGLWVWVEVGRGFGQHCQHGSCASVTTGIAGDPTRFGRLSRGYGLNLLFLLGKSICGRVWQRTTGMCIKRAVTGQRQKRSRDILGINADDQEIATGVVSRVIAATWDCFVELGRF